MSVSKDGLKSRKFVNRSFNNTELFSKRKKLYRRKHCVNVYILFINPI